MSAPLPLIALYARLVEVSSALLAEIGDLASFPDRLRLEALWVHLDDLIEQLPDALAAEAQRQAQEDTR
jgi:hypothetical protein